MKYFKLLFILLITLNLYSKELKLSSPNEYINRANSHYQRFIKDNNISEAKIAIEILKNGLKKFKDNTILSTALYEVESNYILNKYDDEVANNLKSSFDKILKINPNIAMPPSYIKLLKNPKNEAFKLLKEAIKENKMYLPAYIRLIELYQEKKHYNLALATIKRAQKISNNPYILKLKVAVEYFKIYDSDADDASCNADDKTAWKELLKDAKSLLKITSKDPFVYLALSSAYINLGQKSMALYNAKRSIQLENSEIYVSNYHFIQIAIGNAKEALKSNSLDISSKALAYLALQQWEKAKNSFDNVIKTTNSTYFYDYLKKSLAIGMLEGEKKQLEYLKNLPKSVQINNWNKKTIDYLDGKISKEDYILKAKNNCTKTEAYFYIAYKNLRDHNSKEAKKYFQKVLDLKIYGFIEYILSSYYIKKL